MLSSTDPWRREGFTLEGTALGYLSVDQYIFQKHAGGTGLSRLPAAWRYLRRDIHFEVLYTLAEADVAVDGGELRMFR